MKECLLNFVKKGMTFMLLFLVSTSSASAYTISSFGRDSYRTNEDEMNTILGVTNYQIERFESIPLALEGLSVTMSDSSGNGTLYQSYPPMWSFNVWDGLKVLRAAFFDGALTFGYSPGADSFGIGISNSDCRDGCCTSSAGITYGCGEADSDYSGHTLQINDDPSTVTDISNLNGWQDSDCVGGRYRNIYLRIDTEPGDDPITSVDFFLTGGQETLEFDHLAVDPIPEPTTMFLFGSGLIGLAGFRRRLKK